MGLTSFISLAKYPTLNQFSMADRLKQETYIEKFISPSSLVRVQTKRILERQL